MPAWSVVVKSLIKWGPVAFTAARRYYPYIQNSPAAKKFVGQLAEQTTKIPDRLSPDLRARRKIAAVRQSLAEAAVLGVDPAVYTGWRHELDELDRTLTLSQAASRSRRRALVREVNGRLDVLVGAILPALAGPRRSSATLPPELPPPPR
ncbi:MAG: hypothetical protein WAN48_07025 [Actinomycetes bacterium]